jgi:hypothetical protein
MITYRPALNKSAGLSMIFIILHNISFPNLSGISKILQLLSESLHCGQRAYILILFSKRLLCNNPRLLMLRRNYK